jgi:hypothetical protein
MSTNDLIQDATLSSPEMVFPKPKLSISASVLHLRDIAFLPCLAYYGLSY